VVGTVEPVERDRARNGAGGRDQLGAARQRVTGSRDEQARHLQAGKVLDP
jgi:hypothetical protein